MATSDLSDSRDLRNALGTFATGVTVMTASGPDGRPIGMTVNSFSALSLRPPLVLWGLSRQNPGAAAFEEAPRFVVNVLSLQQLSLSRQFSRSGTDKFAGVALRDGANGVPQLAGCLAWFECDRVACHEGGDHLIVVGQVTRYEYASGAPLIFARGRYQRGVDVEVVPDTEGDLAAAWSGLA
ncbi:MAG: flavin reductase family protein [Steroidobacteraceae bacterium]|jgi:flavin reductase (DIM6/NTAB) family NADH-FMN oxidoreductase RutF|nr:flavin reductase family protein [Steroidobacteraceae bacterium]